MKALAFGWMLSLAALTAQAERITINFDGVPAGDQAAAASYLLQRGVGMDTGHTMVRNYAGVNWVRLESAPNALLVWSNAALVFSQPVSNLSFVRLSSDTALPRDAWIATAYDASGNALGTVSERVILADVDVPNQTYLFNVSGIKVLAFNVGADIRDSNGALVDSTQLHIDTLAFDTTAMASTCSGVSNAELFAYGAQRYPSLFAGTPVAGRLGPYDYRYFPGSGNFLAVEDGTCMVWVQGPISGGVPVRVLPVAAIAADVIAARGGATTTSTPTTPTTTTPTTATPTMTTTPPTTNVPDTASFQACTYTASPTSLSLSGAGEAASVNVRQVQSVCLVPNPPWAVTGLPSWLSGQPGALSNGQGPAYITAAPNPGTSSRTATITVAGTSITVTQGAGSNPIAGSYSGSWTGSCPIYGNASVSGSWFMTVSSSGAIAGSFSGPESGTINGSVDASGALSSATGSAGSSSWSGSLGTPRGGTWRTADCSGTWS